MGGAAVHIDVEAVGLIVNHIRLGPQHFKHSLCYAAGRSVSAVQSYLIAAGRNEQ